MGRDTALEITVARKHRTHRQITLADSLGDGFGQKSGIADTGGAADADDIEPQRVEIVLNAGGFQVVSHHAASRRQRGLDPRLGLQSHGHGVTGQQTGGEHNSGVGGVGAAGDGGDDHVAVAQAVIAVGQGGFARGRRALKLGQGFLEGRSGVREGNPVLGPFRPGEAGFNIPHVQFQRGGEDGIGGRGVTPQPLLPGVGFRQFHLVCLAAGKGEEAHGLGVDGEEAAGGTVFRRHISDGGTVGKRQVVESGTEEFHKLAHHPFGAQHFHHPQHQVGGGDAFLQHAIEPEPHHIWHQHGNGLAEHGRFGLDAAHAPAQHAKTVNHGGVAVSADTGIRIGGFFVPLRGGPYALRQIFEIDLVADAGARRHHSEIVESVLSPVQEGIALAVAGKLSGHVAGEGVTSTSKIHCHRMVYHQVHRRERIDLLRIAAHGGHGVAHGGEVNHGGHPGEILHQHPGRTIGDLATARPAFAPGSESFHILAGDRTAVLVAQEIFQQHLERTGQPGNVAKSVFSRRGEAVITISASAHLQRAAARKRIRTCAGGV